MCAFISTTVLHLLGKTGHVMLLTLLGLLLLCPFFESSLSNSFEDGAPVDFIYG